MQRAFPYAVLLALVVALVATPRGAALDHRLVERAAELDRAHPALHAAMKLGTAVGTNTVILAGLLFPAAFAGEVARVTVRAAAVALGATWVSTLALKAITDRARPNGARNRPRSSFPSGHASGAAAVATVVARRHRRRGAWLWLVVAWVGASRVFLDVHYPSDVIAGVLLGALIGAWALRFEVLLGSAAALAHASPTSQPLKL